LKEGGRVKVGELQEELKFQAAKHEEWVSERKHLGTWKVRCLDSEKKMSVKINELEED